MNDFTVTEVTVWGVFTFLIGLIFGIGSAWVFWIYLPLLGW